VTTKENRARGMGIFGAMFGLGFVFGPAIGGILSRYGIHVPFLFAALCRFLMPCCFISFCPNPSNLIHRAPAPLAKIVSRKSWSLCATPDSEP
jgi:MFS family permease